MDVAQILKNKIPSYIHMDSQQSTTNSLKYILQHLDKPENKTTCTIYMQIHKLMHSGLEHCNKVSESNGVLPITKSWAKPRI